jgi:hypothetical protein
MWHPYRIFTHFLLATVEGVYCYTEDTTVKWRAIQVVGITRHMTSKSERS